MKTRINQLVIQILLMVVITAIVTFTCLHLAELIRGFADVVISTLTDFSNVF